MKCGTKVKYYRRKRKLDLDELGEKTGISPIKLMNVENDNAELSDDELEKVLGAVGAKLSDFLKPMKSCFNVAISKSDLVLFLYLVQNGFLDREQILNFFYKDIKKEEKDIKDLKPNTIQMRLSKLTKQGYLRKVKSPMGRLNETLLVPTKKTFDVLVTYNDMLVDLKRVENSSLAYINPEEYVVSTSLDTRNLVHDCHMNNIRFILENNGAYSWKTNRVLYRDERKEVKSNYNHIPDGVFLVSGVNNKVYKFAVEYEATLKKPDSYKNIFEHYALNEGIDFVLYIMSNSLIYSQIEKKISPKFINTPDGFKKFWLMKYENVLYGDLKIYNPSSEPINLKELMR